MKMLIIVVVGVVNIHAGLTMYVQCMYVCDLIPLVGVPVLV